MLQEQPRTRRLILIGTPLLTGILLLFHPRPDPAEMGLTEPLGGMDVYTLLAPVADRFLALHVLFAPALALLGLSVILLLNGVRGTGARFSRVSAFVFVVTYIMYETIIVRPRHSSYVAPPRCPLTSRRWSATPFFVTTETLFWAMVPRSCLSLPRCPGRWPSPWPRLRSVVRVSRFCRVSCSHCPLCSPFTRRRWVPSACCCSYWRLWDLSGPGRRW
jgi:hypothetical protein